MHGNPGGLNPGGTRASLLGTFDNSADILVVKTREGEPLASSGPRTGMLLNVLQPTGHPTTENHRGLSINIPRVEKPSHNHSTHSLVMALILFQMFLLLATLLPELLSHLGPPAVGECNR